MPENKNIELIKSILMAYSREDAARIFGTAPSSLSRWVANNNFPASAQKIANLLQQVKDLKRELEAAETNEKQILQKIHTYKEAMDEMFTLVPSQKEKTKKDIK